MFERPGAARRDLDDDAHGNESVAHPHRDARRGTGRNGSARAYYAELTRAAQSNDTGKLKRLLNKRCPCYRAIEVIDAGAKRGERTPDAAWHLGSVRVHDITGATAVAEVSYRVTAYDVLNDSGQAIDRVSRRDSHLDLSLVKSDGSWVVANVFDLEG